MRTTGRLKKVNLGDTVKYTSKDKNIVTTSGTGKEIDFSLAEKVTIGKDAANGGKPVVIDGKEGIVSGLTNTTLVPLHWPTQTKPRPKPNWTQPK